MATSTDSLDDFFNNFKTELPTTSEGENLSNNLEIASVPVDNSSIRIEIKQEFDKREANFGQKFSIEPALVNDVGKNVVKREISYDISDACSSAALGNGIAMEIDTKQTDYDHSSILQNEGRECKSETSVQLNQSVHMCPYHAICGRQFERLDCLREHVRLMHVVTSLGHSKPFTIGTNSHSSFKIKTESKDKHSRLVIASRLSKSSGVVDCQMIRCSICHHEVAKTSDGGSMPVFPSEFDSYVCSVCCKGRKHKDQTVKTVKAVKTKHCSEHMQHSAQSHMLQNRVVFSRCLVISEKGQSCFECPMCAVLVNKDRLNSHFKVLRTTEIDAPHVYSCPHRPQLLFSIKLDSQLTISQEHPKGLSRVASSSKPDDVEKPKLVHIPNFTQDTKRRDRGEKN